MYVSAISQAFYLGVREFFEGSPLGDSAPD